MTKQTKLAIIGIGRVGLPLGLVFAQQGLKVYGVDVNEKYIQILQRGVMPFLEEGGQKFLKKHLGKNFIPSLDVSVVKDCKFIVLTLGTPVDENMNPSLVQIDMALHALKPFLCSNQVLILRSTVSPGTTEYVRNFINKIKDLNVGRNFYLAFCPERIAEGKAIKELYEIPQIIGGIDRKSAKKAAELFKALKVKCLRTDAVSAELAKLFTNMYRYISFGVANEFMILASKYNRDIYEIVKLVNKDYKRGGLAFPGLTGGACLFKDGFFLINDIPFNDLIATAWKINEAIPLFLIEKIRKRMRLTDKKAVILGAAFKANIDDIRESLSFKVKKALQREGAEVILHDPLIEKYSQDLNKVLENASLVFLATKHDYYLSHLKIENIKALVKKDCLFCDVWNIFKTGKIIFSLASLNKNSPRARI